jgi:chromosome segregation ATPase
MKTQVELLKECCDIKDAACVRYQKRIAELEEENKKLKKECEENDYLVEDNARWMKKCEEKTMEIKKLKSDLAYERIMLDNVRAEYKSLQNVNKKLNEKVRFLEECLDRKEKLNEKYRKELENYVYDAKQVRDIC